MVGVDGEECGVTVGDATNKARDATHYRRPRQCMTKAHLSFFLVHLNLKLKSLLLVNTVDDSTKGTKWFGVHRLFAYVQW